MKARECVEIMCEGFGRDYNSISEALTLLLTEFSDDYDIERRNAASIIHTFIRDVLDVSDITDADELKKCELLSDLYDCRVCVFSIEQVYLRKIMLPQYMLPSGRYVFGGRDEFTKEELKTVISAIKEMIN